MLPRPVVFRRDSVHIPIGSFNDFVQGEGHGGGNTWPDYSCTCIPTPIVFVLLQFVSTCSEQLHWVVSRKRGSQSFVTNREVCTQCRKIVCISKSMNKEFKRIRAGRLECSAFSIRVFFFKFDYLFSIIVCLILVIVCDWQQNVCIPSLHNLIKRDCNFIVPAALLFYLNNECTERTRHLIVSRNRYHAWWL